MNKRTAKRCAQVFLAAAGAVGVSGGALALASGHSEAASTPAVPSTHAVRLPSVVMPTAHSTTTAKAETSLTPATSSIPTPTPPAASGATANTAVRPAVTSPAALNTTTTVAPAAPSPSEPTGECIVTWTAQDGTQSGYDGSCQEAITIAAQYPGAVVASVTTSSPFTAELKEERVDTDRSAATREASRLRCLQRSVAVATCLPLSLVLTPEVTAY